MQHDIVCINETVGFLCYFKLTIYSLISIVCAWQIISWSSNTYIACYRHQIETLDHCREHAVAILQPVTSQISALQEALQLALYPKGVSAFYFN